MQFERKTRAGNINSIIKILIKVILILLVLFIMILLIERIDFPSPIKNIEKEIPNENFKVIK